MLGTMPGDVTLLLQDYKNGDADALNALTHMVYPELKAMARRRTQGNQNLNATALINEVFVKLLSGNQLDPSDRQQFFGLVATVMRQVIVDEVRHFTAQKRKGDEVTYADTISFNTSEVKSEFLLQVDQVLTRLESEEPKLAHVFECRYFAGFSTAETAEIMGTSSRSVERLWTRSRERVAELMELEDND